jgi:hypothetical protein
MKRAGVIPALSLFRFHLPGYRGGVFPLRATGPVTGKSFGLFLHISSFGFAYTLPNQITQSDTQQYSDGDAGKCENSIEHYFPSVQRSKKTPNRKHPNMIENNSSIGIKIIPADIQ